MQVPARHIDAPVDMTGVSMSGAMQIPQDVHRVGWTGAVPAGVATGATLIAGHVDSKTQSKGAFWGLRSVRAGDRVLVTVNGAVLTYRVLDVVQEDKADLPAWASSIGGPHRLVLATCGGSLRAGHYTDNVLVTAVLDD